MFLFREIDLKLCQNYTKTYICKILYKIRNIKHILLKKILNQSENYDIPEESGLLLLLFEFNNFLILTDIIDIIILFIHPDHVTSTPTNGSAVLFPLQSL